MAMYFSSNSLSHNDAVLGAWKALNPYKLQGPTAKVTPNEHTMEMKIVWLLCKHCSKATPDPPTLYTKSQS